MKETHVKKLCPGISDKSEDFILNQKKGHRNIVVSKWGERGVNT